MSEQTSNPTSGQSVPKSRKSKFRQKSQQQKTAESKLRMERRGEKLDAARKKLAKQKPLKPKGPVRRVAGVAGRGVHGFVHGKIYEVEHENVGTEGAHRTELAGETVLRHGTRFVKKQVREHPARAVRRAESRHTKATADYYYRKTVEEHPEMQKGGALSRYLKKQKITKVSSTYKKSVGQSFTLKPKAKGKITYKTGNKKVATVNSKGKVTVKGTGKATITVTAKATSTYSKSVKKITVYGVPKKPEMKKLTAGKKKFTVQWKKDKKADGYQVQYSTDKKFKKNVKSVNVSKKSTKATVKKLKKRKTYRVRVRSYKKINGKKYYSGWGKVKSVKVR